MFIKDSTKAMLRKHGWRIDRFIHNYIYFVFYQPYVRFLYLQSRLAGGFQSRQPGLMSFLRSAFDRYHAKVLSGGNVRKILTLNEDIRLVSEANRQIVPYRFATDIVFRNPEYIAVMDCPCRAATGAGDACGPLNACIAIGRDLASFWIEHCEKYHARLISQQEALELITGFRKRGHITQAFFKVATGGQTGVICNCCPNCCVSLKATRLARRWSEDLSMTAGSGYSVTRDASTCVGCGACAAVCPFGAIVFNDDLRSYDKTLCLGCELCVEHCPQGALSLYRDGEKPIPLDMDIVREWIDSNQEAGDGRGI